MKPILVDAIDDWDPNLAKEIFALSEMCIAPYTCSIHEDCDGHCDGTASSSRPLMEKNDTTRLFETFTTELPTRIQSRSLPAGTISRDEAWLAEQDLDSFIYDDIHSEGAGIRLLKVNPANFKRDVIECEMIEISLDDNPWFTAVSYHWGASQLDKIIICNGKLLAITTNLHGALIRHRQDYNKQSEDLIWVDAVCINQADLMERSQQVMLMHRVYSQASSVFIDLGHADTSWIGGYTLLFKLCIARTIEMKRPKRYPAESLGKKQLYQVYHIPASSESPWQAYFALFASPWFFRTWVVQELVLAKAPVVRLGPFKFRWRALPESLLMSRYLGELRTYAYDDRTQRGIFNVEKLLCLFAKHHNQSHSIPALEAIVETQEFEATDPCDKVNGILGLVKERPQSDTMAFQADYTLSVDTLYHRFAIYSVKARQLSLLLQFAGLQRLASKPKTLPSWVPDWAAYSQGSEDGRFGGLGNTKFWTSRNSEPHSHLRRTGDMKDPDLLVVIGDEADTIVGLSDPLHPTKGYKQNLNGPAQIEAFIAWHNHSRALICSPTLKEILYSRYRDVDTAFARTIIANHTEGDTNPNDATSVTDPIYAPKITWLVAMTCLAAIANKIGSQDDIRGEIGRRGPIKTFLVRAFSWPQERRFVMTRKGYMDLLPACTRLCDRIAVVLGAPVPFVLRPKGADGDMVQLVGDAYIHGIMNGEAMDAEEFAPREITIY